MFWINAGLQLVVSSLVAVNGALTCGTADTKLPRYPNLNSSELKNFKGFTGNSANKSSLISDMFRESGVTRRCLTWQDFPQACSLRLECRTFACFGHMEGETHDPETEIVTEIYGFGGTEGWITAAFSKQPLKSVGSYYYPIDALQIECVGASSPSVKLQVSYLDSSGIPNYLTQNEVNMYFRLVEWVNDPLLKDHLYCKVYMKTLIDLANKNKYFTTDFDFTHDLYFVTLAVGEKHQGFSGGYYNLWGTCSMPIPTHPIHLFRSFDLAESDQIYLIIHGCLMVFIFVFLFPAAIFPIRYLKYQLDNYVENWGIKLWLWHHLKYAIPIYPIMLIAVQTARAARGHKYRFQTSTNSSYVHGTVGTMCFQLHSVQFFIGLFAYPFLAIKTNVVMRSFHYIMNYFVYAMSVQLILTLKYTRYPGTKTWFFSIYHVFLCFQFGVHFCMTFYHFIIRQTRFQDPKFFKHVNVHTFLQILGQSTKEVQRQPFQAFHLTVWRYNNIFSFVFAVALMFCMDTGPRFYEGSVEFETDFLLIGQVFYNWEYYWIWLF